MQANTSSDTTAKWFSQSQMQCLFTALSTMLHPPLARITAESPCPEAFSMLH